ncbi:tigger transposable element-derived protein 6-like [Hydractinia symbiolongicarpus]|uniref:tigger transposable element-derived protein 6-like n=1 Tax=Hydractinia symbiolongicarpus TaxID=13093 RepID=UPI00254B89AC|nr:tigger transposable element-derived protein 6-like [Hydractinia symbiolongicarpus]
MKPDTHEQVNKAVLKWFTRIQAENVPVSGIHIKEKALYYAKELNFEKFQASDGWLNKYGISFKTIVDESKSVTKEMLPTIRTRYPLENIFNADGYERKLCGGKYSKVRLTGVAAGNAKGERLSVFVIGKAKKIQEVSKVLKVFRVVTEPSQKVMDNCPAHPHVWVEFIFLPSNTSSVTKPMDRGVIRALKAKYRSLSVNKQLDNLEKEKQLPKFQILTPIAMLNKAWGSIPDRTF